MADRTIKPDDTNNLVLQNNDGSAKIEINEAGTVAITGTVSGVSATFTGNTTYGDQLIGAYSTVKTKHWQYSFTTDGSGSTVTKTLVSGLDSSDKVYGIVLITCMPTGGGARNQSGTLVFAWDGSNFNSSTNVFGSAAGNITVAKSGTDFQVSHVSMGASNPYEVVYQITANFETGTTAAFTEPT